jgi:hypothetical protein
LYSKISILYILQNLSFISKSFHFKTLSKAFSPPIFRAEYLGGICLISQVNFSNKIFSIFSFEIFFEAIFCSSEDIKFTGVHKS